MPKQLAFTIDGCEYKVVPEKIDRKKLYGWAEKIALDQDGNECTPVNTADFVTLILHSGCIGSGMVSPYGEWVERSSLAAVNACGERMELLPSSFSVKNPLEKTVSPEEFLNYAIIGVYQLGADKDFCTAIGEDIRTFSYRYRDGYESTNAFILQSNGMVFMLLGVNAGIEMITLDQIAVLDDENDQDETDEDDTVDFSFM